MILVTNNDKSAINRSLIRFKREYLGQMNSTSEVDRYNNNLRIVFEALEKFKAKLENMGGHLNYSGSFKPISHSTSLDIVLARSNELQDIEPCFELLESDFRSWNIDLDNVSSTVANQINDIGRGVYGYDDSGNSYSEITSALQQEARELEASLPQEVVTDILNEAREESNELLEEEQEDEPVVFDFPEDTVHTGTGGDWSNPYAEALAKAQEEYAEAAGKAGEAGRDYTDAITAMNNARDEVTQAIENANRTNEDYYATYTSTIASTGGAKDGIAPGETVQVEYNSTVTNNGDGTITITTTDTTMTISVGENNGWVVNGDGTVVPVATAEDLDNATQARTEAAEAVAKANEDYFNARENAEEAGKTFDDAAAKATEAENNYNNAQSDYNSAESAHTAQEEAETNYISGSDYSPQNPPIDSGDDLDGNDISGK